MRDPIDDELGFHFEQLRQERLKAGDTPEQATAYARQRLGSPARIRDEVQDLSLFHRLEFAWRQARFALRSYRRHGGAYILATAILALGIGLSVSMFSLVHAVVLSPLPFPQQDRVHLVWKMDTQVKQALVGEMAYPELADLRANSEIEAVALIPAAFYGNGRVLQVDQHEPVQIESCPTTPDLFKALGVRPALGRDFTAADSTGAPVVILSDGVWRRHFSARPDVVGSAVRLNGVAHTVIGVMPAAVDFPRGVGMWMPLRPNLDRGLTWLQAVARARPGVTREALFAAADRTFKTQFADHPEVYSRTQRAVVTPIADFLTGSSKLHLLLSLGASLLLLISAAVSASNLFLSRTLARRREVATRVSLGASRGQILAQFATEGLLAALLATLAGTALASLAIRVLIHWAPPDIPRLESASLNGTALAFATSVAVLAAIACFTGPALLLRRETFEGLLRQTRTTGTRSGRRLQAAFVFAQAALTVAILAVGLMLALSYRTMLDTDLGFAHRDTLTVNLSVKGPQSAPPARRLFYTELLRRLREAPEVSHAAAVLLRPLEGPIGWDSEYLFEYEAGQRDPHLLTVANFEVVTPGYFDVVGTPLLSGRDFTERDDEAAEKVIIISRTLANRVRATGREPLGQRMRVSGAWRKIIGVTADTRYRRVVQPLDDVYVPHLQANPPTNYLVVRGPAPTAALAALIRKTLKEMDPNQAVAGEATLGELMARNTARPRFQVSLLLLFAAGAILLAAAGVHSVIGESVAVRAKEIALKIALGARRGHLVRESVQTTMLMVVAGTIVGLALAVAAGLAALDLLYGVTPSDARVLAPAALLVLTAALASATVPAWIAAGADARDALQGE